MRGRGLRLAWIALALLSLHATAFAKSTESGDAAPEAVQAALDTGRYARADTLARAALSDLEARGERHSLAAAELLDLLVDALRLEDQSSRPETRALGEEALALRRELLPPGDVRIAYSLAALGRLLTTVSELDSAKPLLDEGLELRRAQLDRNDPLLGRSLADLAGWQSWHGDFQESEATYREVVRIYEAAYGPNHPKTARAILSLCNPVSVLARYDEEETLLARAAAIYQKAGMTEHPEYGVLEHVRGSRFQALGQYDAAVEALQHSVDIFDHSLGPDSQELTRPLTSLGTIARRRGDYAKARLYQERALAIAEKSLGREHLLVANYCNNLAGVLYELGSLKEALPYVERGLRIREKALPPDHPDLAQSYRSMAILTEELGDRARAATYYQKALTSYEARLGPTHPEVALVLLRLAELSRDLGELPRALDYTARGVAIAETGPLRGHPDHAAMLEVRASLLREMGQCDSALVALERARQMIVEQLGEDHFQAVQYEHERAVTLAAMGRTDEAAQLALEVERRGRERLFWNARLLPEDLALDFQRTRESGLDLLLSLTAATGGSALASSAWDALARSRGLLLEEMAQRQRVAGWSDPSAEPERRRLARAVERMARLQLEGPGDSIEEYRAALDSARVERAESEDALLLRSAYLREEFSRERLSLDEIRSALPDSAALVAYVRYGQMNLNGADGPAPCGTGAAAPGYLVFVLSARDGEPHAVPLGSADEIDELVAAWRGAAGHAPREGDEEKTRAAAARLSIRVWEPVRALLGDAHRVFVVADGSIHGVSFAAMPGAHGEYTVDDGFDFQTLNAERELVPRALEDDAGEGFLAFADPDYDARPESADASAKPTATAAGAALGAAAAARGSATRCPEFRDLHWRRLPRTNDEAKQAADIWRASADRMGAHRSRAGAASVRVLRDAAASEAAFKADAPRSSVLHLATHGFFLAGDCNEDANTRGLGGVVADTAPVDSLGRPELRLAGLVLAGANRAINAGDGGTPSGDDGILTADEIATLDLRSVQWAVLSACDTGLGEPRAGEGVLGLRRSFLIAGVRTIVMSLWSIDDAATARWMTELYRVRYGEAQSAMHAVALADQRILASRREAGESTHPFYWAAFQVSGDWR
ncbi:MAG: CHAT domain-containing tetratricopeptide repeat protein [Candidatus Eisenbacteria bacterium]